MSFTSIPVPKNSVYCLLLSTRSMPDHVVDPEMFPVTPDHSAESSLHRQVCVSGGLPFQAQLLLYSIYAVSNEKYDKRKGTPFVGP